MIALTLTLVLLAGPLATERPELPEEQLLIVTTPSWDATHGVAVLLEGGEVVAGPTPIRVGRSGLAWGLGEHEGELPAGPTKREGDGRAPAGIFAIGARWERDGAAGLACVDDPEAADYNRVVPEPRDGDPPWSSAEDMTDYRVAIWVAHNPESVPRGGSCIFLHDVRRGDDGETIPTAGCTAFEPDVLDALSARLRPGARLVQLPAPIYQEVARAWRLPSPARLGLGD